MIDWSWELTARLKELMTAPEGHSESQIANIMTEEFETYFSRDSVHNKLIRLRDTNLRTLLDKPVTDMMPYYTKYKDIIESGYNIFKIIEEEKNQIYFEMLKERLKILHLGDLHIPFQDDNQIQLAMDRNATADLVITTEIVDCYSISRFNRNFAVPFYVEVDNALRYFEALSETFPLTLVMAGNHDKRISKQFMRGVPDELLFLVKENLLRLLAKPFNNIIVSERPVLQVNDAVFTHAEYFSKIDLKAGMSARQFLIEWAETLGLRPYKLVVQSHTHMLGSTYRGGSLKVFESGCLCKVPDYAVVGFYSKPQTNGYLTIVQHDGVTDFNLSRDYVFPTQKYIPNDDPILGAKDEL